MDFFDRGTAERFKAGAHGTLEGLAVLFGAYNALAFLDRLRRGRVEWHLALNVSVYACVYAFERSKRRHHHQKVT